MSGVHAPKLSYTNCKYFKDGKCKKRKPKEPLVKKGRCVRTTDCLDFDSCRYF